VDSFDAIADPTRRRLIELLTEGERPAGELASHFDISFPAISQQLRILSEAKLVQARREGRNQVYRLNPESLDPVAEWLEQYATNFWKKKLNRLGGVVANMQAKMKKESEP
jgi:DNA-binding transcriptional ArsR family regulator